MALEPYTKLCRWRKSPYRIDGFLTRFTRFFSREKDGFRGQKKAADIKDSAPEQTAHPKICGKFAHGSTRLIFRGSAKTAVRKNRKTSSPHNSKRPGAISPGALFLIFVHTEISVSAKQLTKIKAMPPNGFTVRRTAQKVRRARKDRVSRFYL